jgi:molybdopterin/thiamine biosynthesis adenylyltransferase
MTALWVSLLESHLSELRRHLFRDQENERAAYVFFGTASIGETKLSAPARLLVSHAVEYIQPEAMISSSPSDVTWETSDVIKRLKVAQGRKLILGIVHNHIGGTCEFSQTDDANESELVRTFQNRNGSDCLLASILLTPDNKWRARLWLSPTKCIDACELRTVGDRIKIAHPDDLSSSSLPAFLDRQVLAFGQAFNQQLRRLRIAIVGCGGTGSAVAMLLARLGVRSVALIDSDTVEESNLNRLHGANRSDALTHQSKVGTVARAIAAIDLETKVSTHNGWVSDLGCRDILKGAHIIFGCTDDNAGRILLNRFAYAYQIPVIDMGLAVQLSDSDRPDVQAMDGRVTVMVPGDACLLCRGVIDARRASEESLKRKNPTEYERRKSEAYVLGEQDPSPAVVTFTTELACMAVNEMIHRMQGYRGETGSTANRVRLFHRMLDLRPSRRPDPDCRVCGQQLNWCRGDIEPFLGIVA